MKLSAYQGLFCAVVIGALLACVPGAEAARDRIAFTQQTPLGYAVMTADDFGANARQIVAPLSGSGRFPALSPDGQQLLYADGLGGVWVTTLATGFSRQVYAGNAYHPAWAPDQKSLAFSKQIDSSNWDIYRINLDGTGLAPVVTWNGIQRFPTYGPQNTGRKIAFASNTTGPRAKVGSLHVYTANEDGSGAQAVTTTSSVLLQANTPAFSRDGRLAFAGLGPDVGSNGTLDDWDIWVANANGSGLVRLTNDLRYNDAPRWSADGQRLIYNTQETSDLYSVWLMSADGSGQGQFIASAPGSQVMSPTYRQPSSVIDTYDFLAAEYRPRLFFDGSEQWRPLSVDALFAERVGSSAAHAVCGTSCVPATDTSSLKLETAQDNGAAPYLDLNADGTRLSSPLRAGYRTTVASCIGTTPDGLERLDCDSGPRSVMYYRVSTLSPGGYRYLDYWIFYRFNYATSATEDLNHEGDWESVTIAPSKDDTDTWDFASFSQHGTWYSYLRASMACDGDGMTFGTCGDENNRIGKRVSVFPADGTHANYPLPCDSSPCGQGDPPVPERRGNGAAAWGGNEEDPGTALVKLPPPAGWPAPAPSPDTRVWVDWPGRWGWTVEDTGSPNSPANQQPHWATPWADVQCAGLSTGCALASRYPADGSMRARSALPPVGTPRIGAHAARARQPVPWVKYCGDWFGPRVIAVACDPYRLDDAVDRQEMNRGGSMRLRISGRHGARSAAAPGLSQILGRPMRPRQSLTVTGKLSPRTVLLVRGMAGKRTVESRFAGSLRQLGPFRVRLHRAGRHWEFVIASRRGTIRPSTTRVLR